MLRGERIARNPWARVPVGNCSAGMDHRTPRDRQPPDGTLPEIDREEGIPGGGSPPFRSDSLDLPNDRLLIRPGRPDWPRAGDGRSAYLAICRSVGKTLGFG